MKTLHNFSTAQNISDIKSNIRLTLTVVGVMTAVICSLILFNDHESTHAFSQLPELMKASKNISVNATVDVKNIDVVSAVRSVKW